MNRRNFLSLSLLASVGTVIPFKTEPRVTQIPHLTKYVFRPIDSMTMRAGENIKVGCFVEIINGRLFLASNHRGCPIGVSMNNAHTGQPTRILIRGMATVRSA